MYNIGVDVGGISIKAGLVKNGEIILKNSVKTNPDGKIESLVKNIENVIYDILKNANLKIEEISTIGIGIPGMVNKFGEISCPNLFINNKNLLEPLKKIFSHCKIMIANDANVAALAEYKFGSMKEYDSAVMLTLGTGIGGGIIINDNLITGSHGIGAEIGHMVISNNYYDCNCGNNGCFETFCSATAVIKYAQKLINEGNKSIILNKSGKIEDITAKDIFDSFKEGDRVSILVIERFKEYLALGIANIINFIDPEVISIGGGLSNSSDIIFDGLENRIRKYLVFKNEPIAKIVVAKFKNDAGILGASAL